ncbi:hypothetical protein D3C72_2497070 [compost metagenome]
MQAIAKLILVAGFCLLLRYPHRDNIIVNFVIGRDLHQLYLTLAPVALGLNP